MQADQHDGEFPGFSFCFIYSRLRAEEAGNPKMSTGAFTQNPNKPAPSNPIGPGKELPRKTEKFVVIITLLLPNTTQKL